MLSCLGLKISRPSRANAPWTSLLVLVGLMLTSSADEAWLEAATAKYQLRERNDSYLVAPGCPAPDLSIYLSFTYSAPGTLLDTVGIGAAEDGDWYLSLGGDSTLVLGVYSHAQGWQRIQLAGRVRAGRLYHLMLAVHDAILDSEVYEDESLLNALSARLKIYLSSSPVYAGDFPGDNSFGPGYDIYQACKAELQVHYLGRRIPELNAQNIRGSLVSPSDGGTVPTPGDTPSRNENPPSQQLQVAEVAPAPTPEDAVLRLLEAQVRGDTPAVLGYTYLDKSPLEASLTTQNVLQLIAGKLKFSDLSFEALATAYGNQGNLAIVRCRHGVYVEGKGESSREEFGSLVVVRKSGAGWKVVQFVPDDLLNVVIADERHASSKMALQVGLQAAPAKPVPPSKAVPGMVEYRKLSESFEKSVNGWKFDEQKIFYDEMFSFYGWAPVFGDTVSKGYTAVQIVKTLYSEFLPDLCNLDASLLALDITQIGVGLLQIAAEDFTGLDVLMDNLGTAVDQYKYNVVQARNFSRLRLAIAYANLDGIKKYLFLRPSPIYSHPEHGIRSGMQINADLQFYDEWEGKQKPLKKITFLSDIPLRYWKHLDFDMGFQMTILRGESQALFDAAVALGIQPRMQDQLFPDSYVYIPVRLGTTGKYRQVEGEFDPHQLAKQPRMEATPKLTTTGTDILKNPRIISGENAADRFIRMDVSPIAGPNQSVQINLLTGDNNKTEPVFIENAVYNNLTGAIAFDQQDKPILSDAPTIDLAMGETADLKVLGNSPSCPYPCIIGAPVSEWSIEQPAVCEMELLGGFPDAKLRLTGKTQGLTILNYFIFTGDERRQYRIDGVIKVRVGAAMYKLVDTSYVAPQSVNGMVECENSRGKVEWRFAQGPDYPPDAIVRGTWSWNPPPETISNGAAKWDLECTFDFSVESKTPGSADQFEWGIWLEAPVWQGIDKRVITWGEDSRLGLGNHHVAKETILLSDFLIGMDGISPGWRQGDHEIYLKLHFSFLDSSPTVTYTYRKVEGAP